MLNRETSGQIFLKAEKAGQNKRERGQIWLVKFVRNLCEIGFERSNHKKVYDCAKKMNKKAVTIVAAFLLSNGV